MVLGDFKSWWSYADDKFWMTSRTEEGKLFYDEDLKAFILSSRAP
jgi:hypothetical protein